MISYAVSNLERKCLNEMDTFVKVNMSVLIVIGSNSLLCSFLQVKNILDKK